MSRKDQIRALLGSIVTGDPEPVAVVSTERYVQHNPQTHEGSEGLATLFRRLSQTNPKVRVVRAFEDGDFVFAHTEYDFGAPRVGFEIFRFEDGLVVEHWDNIQRRESAGSAGRSMTEGPTEAWDLEWTERNREVVRSFVEGVLIPGRWEGLVDFVAESIVQHSPRYEDGLSAWRSVLEAEADGQPTVRYDRLHRVLAEGNFVLTASEGSRSAVHSAFYDLYRVEDGRIVEHWDTVEAIPPRSEWKNDNGKF